MHNRPAHSLQPLHISAIACLCHALLLVMSSFPIHASDAPKHAYETSFTNVSKICAELHQALDAAKRQQLQAEPVLLEQLNIPCLTPATASRNGSSATVVQVSAGFIAWINRASHARALDESQPGCFSRYLTAIASVTNGNSAQVGQDLAPETVWSFETMNHQAGLFNQMTGALLAIDLAHHYLGHYKKHSARLEPASDSPVPISPFLSEKEWREAVLQGARNALACGLGVDGLRAILDGFDKMPNRPAWSAHFVHPKASLGKLSRDLQKLENDFFLVEK